MFINHLYIYKQDLALNNLQCLICHKTKPNQTKPKPNLENKAIYEICLKSNGTMWTLGETGFKEIVLLSYMISWKYITVILAFYNHCIFFSDIFCLHLFFRLFSYEYRRKNKTEIFGLFGKTKHLKCFNKCMEVILSCTHVFLSCTRGSKKFTRRWKMIPRAGGLQQAGQLKSTSSG